MTAPVPAASVGVPVPPEAFHARSSRPCDGAALRAAVFAVDPWRTTALTPLVTIGGSLVAGLACIEDAFDAEVLWKAVSLDELYQERRWGSDSEAQKARAAHKRDWDNAVRFLGLLT